MNAMTHRSLTPARGFNATWTKAQLDEAEALWAAGKTSGQIARHTGRSRNSICGMMNRYRDRFARRLGLPRNAGVPKTRTGHAPTQWTADDIATAKRLWARETRIADIACELDRSEDAVARYIKTHRDIFPHRRQPASSPLMFANPRIRALPEAIEAPDSKPVAFWQTTDRHCKFPLWGNDEKPGPESPCCGSSIDLGAVYCGFHLRVAGKVYAARAA